MEHKNAFTLTEVLLAVVIVGVIAALILPAMISKFNEQTLELGFKREINTISSAIDSLAVSENKTDFFSTMMYLDVVPESYDDSAGKFLKKYLRVAKYCGDDASDCFASKYYTYSNNEKKGYTPDYNGACARLKNGMSICMSPQIGAKNIEGIIDLNGAKGPNVLGRDLRKFELQLKSRTNNVADSTEVIVANNGLVDLDTEETPEPPTDPCVDDNNSLSCCQVRGIVDSNDPCCTYNDFKGDSACKKNASVTATCRSATKIGAGVTPDGYTYNEYNVDCDITNIVQGNEMIPYGIRINGYINSNSITCTMTQSPKGYINSCGDTFTLMFYKGINHYPACDRDISMLLGSGNGSMKMYSYTCNFND